MKLVGFELLERGIPRKDYPLLNEQGDTIGRVTSGTMSPSLKKGIGMGYVQSDYAKPGSKIFVRIRINNVPSEVVKLPFYRNK